MSGHGDAGMVPMGVVRGVCVVWFHSDQNEGPYSLMHHRLASSHLLPSRYAPGHDSRWSYLFMVLGWYIYIITRMKQLLKKKNLQNHQRSNPIQFNIGLIPYLNHQNYSWYYKRCPNMPLTTPHLQQVVFSNPFQNLKEVFLLQNPSFLYNKPVFQRQYIYIYIYMCVCGIVITIIV